MNHVFKMTSAEQCWPFSGHDTPYQISVCNRTNASPLMLQKEREVQCGGQKVPTDWRGMDITG
jgi:hypothetical protein